jgi:hypothetical protein
MPKNTQLLPHDMRPECASTMATITTQIKQIMIDQTHITDTMWGNGKTGIKDQTEANSRDILEITKILRETNEARRLEIETRRGEAKTRDIEIKQRRGDILKWWLGIITAIILAIIAIAKDISTQTLLLSLGVR